MIEASVRLVGMNARRISEMSVCTQVSYFSSALLKMSYMDDFIKHVAHFHCREFYGTLCLSLTVLVVACHNTFSRLVSTLVNVYVDLLVFTRIAGTS